MDNCITCGKVEKEEEELVEVDKGGRLCESCYEDGLTDSTMHMALYYPCRTPLTNRVKPILPD